MTREEIIVAFIAGAAALALLITWLILYLLERERIGHRRQIQAARAAVMRLIVDPRTGLHPHVRLSLEEQVLPLLTIRRRAESDPPPEPPEPL